MLQDKYRSKLNEKKKRTKASPGKAGNIRKKNRKKKKKYGMKLFFNIRKIRSQNFSLKLIPNI
jgi:hypothetical protein